MFYPHTVSEYGNREDGSYRYPEAHYSTFEHTSIDRMLIIDILSITKLGTIQTYEFLVITWRQCYTQIPMQRHYYLRNKAL